MTRLYGFAGNVSLRHLTGWSDQRDQLEANLKQIQQHGQLPAQSAKSAHTSKRWRKTIKNLLRSAKLLMLVAGFSFDGLKPALDCLAVQATTWASWRVTRSLHCMC